MRKSCRCFGSLRNNTFDVLFNYIICLGRNQACFATNELCNLLLFIPSELLKRVFLFSLKNGTIVCFTTPCELYKPLETPTWRPENSMNAYFASIDTIHTPTRWKCIIQSILFDLIALLIKNKFFFIKIK